MLGTEVTKVSYYVEEVIIMLSVCSSTITFRHTVICYMLYLLHRLAQSSLARNGTAHLHDHSWHYCSNYSSDYNQGQMCHPGIL